MKVYIKYEPSDAGIALGAKDATTLAIKLPKGWYAGPVSRVLNLFVEQYNKKFPDANLAEVQLHVVSSDGRDLANDAVVQEQMQAGDDVVIAVGPAPSSTLPAPPRAPVAATSSSSASSDGAKSSTSAPAPTAGLLQCRNYGCMKQYREEDNSETACKHHVSPPVFHETKKGWGCCKEKMAYDWDDFMKIEGCSTGRHSTVDPKVKFAPSPTVASANAAAEAASASSAAPSLAAAAPAAVKSIDSYNASNPTAVTAASSAVKTVTTRPKARVREDGRAFCINKGCGKWYLPLDVSEDAAEACTHHPAGPIFHDAHKSWSCCKKSAFEFEDFVKLEGCTKGRHDAGELPSTATSRVTSTRTNREPKICSCLDR